MIMHIAIVEDVKAHAEKLVGFLERYQREANIRLDVLCYPGGTEFLEAFRKQFDLILLDVAMDGMPTTGADNGIQLSDMRGVPYLLAFCVITCIVSSINCMAGAFVPNWLYNIGTTVLNGGVSMVVFFIVNKIVFSDAQPAEKK